jgi:uncharacterized protein
MRIDASPSDQQILDQVGLKQPHPHLFPNIGWSTQRVFGQTLERATSLGLAVETPLLWYYVDNRTSLCWLGDEPLLGSRSSLYPGEGYLALRVTRLLRRLAASDAARPEVDHLTDEVVP